MIGSSHFKGVFQDKVDRFFTLNFTPGIKVYGEKIIIDGNDEFREINPRKSKLGAALVKGISQIGIKPGSLVLYLGCSTGTTISHVSDIIGSDGFVFGLDFAPRVMRDMVFVAEARKNIAPILADANLPKSYLNRVFLVDVVYQDIAQKNQVQIFLKNCSMYLKTGGFGLLFVKARSIDVTKKPTLIFDAVRKDLELDASMIIVDYKTLDPLEKDHCVFVCKKK